MTTDVVMSVVVLLAIIAVSWALMYGFMWVVMRLSALIPYTGKKHRHARWGEDLTRRKRTRRRSD